MFVAVETVSAGKDGMEMLVKSGWGENTLNNGHQRLRGFIVCFFFRLLEHLEVLSVWVYACACTPMYMGVNTLEHSFEGPLLKEMHDKTKKKNN